MLKDQEDQSFLASSTDMHENKATDSPSDLLQLKRRNQALSQLCRSFATENAISFNCVQHLIREKIRTGKDVESPNTSKSLCEESQLTTPADTVNLPSDYVEFMYSELAAYKLLHDEQCVRVDKLAKANKKLAETLRRRQREEHKKRAAKLRMSYAAKALSACNKKTSFKRLKNIHFNRGYQQATRYFKNKLVDMFSEVTTNARQEIPATQRQSQSQSHTTLRIENTDESDASQVSAIVHDRDSSRPSSQASSKMAAPALDILDLDANERCLTLRNRDSRPLNVDQWRVTVHLNSIELVTYEFAKNTQLAAETTVHVWCESSAKKKRHSPPTDIVLLDECIVASQLDTIVWNDRWRHTLLVTVQDSNNNVSFAFCCCHLIDDP